MSWTIFVLLNNTLGYDEFDLHVLENLKSELNKEIKRISTVIGKRRREDDEDDEDNEDDEGDEDDEDDGNYSPINNAEDADSRFRACSSPSTSSL